MFVFYSVTDFAFARSPCSCASAIHTARLCSSLGMRAATHASSHERGRTDITAEGSYDDMEGVEATKGIEGVGTERRRGAEGGTG